MIILKFCFARGHCIFSPGRRGKTNEVCSVKIKTISYNNWSCSFSCCVACSAWNVEEIIFRSLLHVTSSFRNPPQNPSKRKNHEETAIIPIGSQSGPKFAKRLLTRQTAFPKQNERKQFLLGYVEINCPLCLELISVIHFKWYTLRYHGRWILKKKKKNIFCCSTELRRLR